MQPGGVADPLPLAPLAPTAAPASSSDESQVSTLQKRNEELEQRTAELQRQLEIQRAANVKPPPRGYKAVSLTSRPFAEPFLWPTRPLQTTVADLSYAERLQQWALDLQLHMYAEVDYMKSELAARAELEKRWNQERAAKQSEKPDGGEGATTNEAPPQAKKRKGVKTES